jgi:hypothetical protein
MPQPWHAADNSVRLELTRFLASVHPLAPSAGLSDIRIDGEPQAGLRLLGLELPSARSPSAAPQIEHYTRGGDLIATYHDWPAPAMRSQVYWRATSHELNGAIAAIEWVVSVQTSLLDSCPQLSAGSTLSASEVLHLVDAERGTFATASLGQPDTDSTSRPNCYLFRLADGRTSYAEMVMPTDSQASRCMCGSTDDPRHVRLTHRLFADRLEKGVILRARILGVFVDRADDRAIIAWHYADFLAEKLPLTT